jgi:glutamyl-tRNA(Gln) amidotransferase subunit D
MYSPSIEKKLSESGAGIGDEVEVTGRHSTFTGILMPRQAGDPDIIVLKLDSGYNIGIDSKEKKITLIRKNVLRKTPLPKEDPNKKGDVAILGCGGTIASKIEYRTGAVQPAISAGELRRAFPGLESIAPVHSRSVFSMLSEDMNVGHWELVANAIEEEIRDGASGVVVMHGTDTMSYTAAAMSFAFADLPSPVVFVGSQRSSDRPSSENEMNISNAVFAATKNIGEVGICMHESINDDYCLLHRGTRARKMHTSRRDAFRSINSPPLARLDYRSKTFSLLSGFRKRSKQDPSKYRAKKEFSQNVAMLYSYPGIRPEMLSGLSSYDGVVLVGTGLGHVPVNAFGKKDVHSLIPAIRELVDSGIPVVMSSQAISGRLCHRVYSAGRMIMDAGAIGDMMDWTPEAAYAKLCFVLGQTKDMKEIRHLMESDLAGEISARSSLEVSP